MANHRMPMHESLYAKWQIIRPRRATPARRASGYKWRHGNRQGSSTAIKRCSAVFCLPPASWHRTKKCGKSFGITQKKLPLHPHQANMVDVAQLVRASDCGSEGRGFEPLLPPSPNVGTKSLQRLLLIFYVKDKGSKDHHRPCIV